MKRTIPAVACILVALLAGIWAFAYTYEKSERLTARINDTLTETGDAFFASAEELCNSWESVQMAFGAVLKHSDADELATLFYTIQDCVSSRDENALRDALIECRTALRVIVEGEKLDVANVF